MQIERAHGLEPLGIPDGSANLARPGQVRPSPGKEEGGPSAAEPELELYIRQAAEAEEVRAEAVAEAKRLLESGELDTPEAAERAAQGLLDLGI